MIKQSYFERVERVDLITGSARNVVFQNNSAQGTINFILECFVFDDTCGNTNYCSAIVFPA